MEIVSRLTKPAISMSLSICGLGTEFFQRVYCRIFMSCLDRVILSCISPWTKLEKNLAGA